MTLNPIKHLDPLGVVLFALAGFGWAKPVPINPNNFRNYRKGYFLTSAAGITVNYIMAFLFYPLLVLGMQFLLPTLQGMYAEIFFNKLLYSLYVYSLSSAVFNLLPIYPLDGFRMVEALDKRHGKVYRFLRRYGVYIFYGLVLLGIVADYIPSLYFLDVLGYAINFVGNIFGWPIMKFWDLIFRRIF